MRRRLALCVATLVGAAGLLGAAQANGATATFDYTGGEETFTVPAGVTSVRIFAQGAHGGNSGSSGNIKYGGLGRLVAANFPVTPGQVLYVNVGGNGGVGTGGGGGAGGFNGGGPGGGPSAGGGGGASDVRTASSIQTGSLGTRLIMAGGGGGGAAGDGTCSGPGDCPGNGGSSGRNGSAGAASVGGTCVGGGGGQAGGAPGRGATRPGPGLAADDGIGGVVGQGGAGGRFDLAGGGGGGGDIGGGGGGAGKVFTGPLCFAYPGGGGAGRSAWASQATNVSLGASPGAPPGAPSVSFRYVSNDFTFGKPKLNKRKGTAKLPVKVPGPGALRLAKTKRVKGASASAAGAGTVRLAVRPTRRTLRKLRRRGKAAVEAKVTYSPTGGAAKAKTKKLTLRMKR